MAGINCILYPPTLDYHHMVQRPQQLMSQFSQLGITTLFMNLPGVNKSSSQGIERLNPYLYILNKVDPLPYLEGIRPVVYFSATEQVDMVAQYNASLVVFDSLDEPSDEFSAWRPYYHRAVTAADVVLCTSDKLYNMARELNQQVYLAPNGCDYDYFSRAALEELPVPMDMRQLDGPVIGYIGAVATWVDLALINFLARALPQCNLVMIGPLYNVMQVPRRPNIHWLGFKPYEQLAAYARCFDVGIIPFRQTGMVESVNPIKMWEYMAAGIPVVSTGLPEAKKYQPLIYCSHDHRSFLNQVRFALENDSADLREQRMALARENSWQARAGQIIEIIQQRLQEKHPDPPAEIIAVPVMEKAPPQQEPPSLIHQLIGNKRLKVSRAAQFSPSILPPRPQNEFWHRQPTPSATRFSNHGLHIDTQTVRRGNRSRWI